MLVCVALADAQFLAVLSSFVHATWALAAGGRLGVGNDPRYNKSRCFEPFPFPVSTNTKQAQIRDLAEQLDAHRKRQQAAYPDLTLTGMYNVLDKLRSGAALSAKERSIHEHGLVSVLRQLHDEIDAAVLDAYGWNDLLPLLRVAHGLDAGVPRVLATPANLRAAAGAHSVRDAVDTEAGEELSRTECVPAGVAVDVGNGSTSVATEVAPTVDRAVALIGTPGSVGLDAAQAKRAFDEAILERLMALNAGRAAEEARGVIRWLRPEFQHPATQAVPEQTEIVTTAAGIETSVPAAAIAKPRPWPKDTVAQVRAVANALSVSPIPLSVDELATRFTARGAWKKRLPQLLDMLVALGRASEHDARFSAH